ncbi:MAG: DUF72 domain-containing protein [Alphaproteobacteria bacterium]|nr:DUF72 domain-containing protein [Alphaproteobacteria bacterium]
MAGAIRIGVGGWTFAPWRGVFYPKGLAQKRELEFASRMLTSIEINGTYYSTFKPDSWRKWRDETPDGFVFAVKASRFCTNRKVLAGAGPAVDVFLAQGLTELGTKLGPINWQFAETKKFDAADFGAFLALLPAEENGLALRHAVEVRNPSFATPAFYEMCGKRGIAIVHAKDEEFPEIDQATADFTYARFMTASANLKAGVSPAALAAYATQARAWARRGDVFAYFISGAKVRNPAAAQALIAKLGVTPSLPSP